MTETAKPQSVWQKLAAIAKTKAFQFTVGGVLVILVLFLLSREVHPEEILKALRQANVWWVVAAFAIGITSWFGAAMPLKMLPSIKVPYREALLVQISASFVNVAVPGGLGTASLDLDYLKRRGLRTSRSVAVVALVELAQAAATVLLFGIVLLFDHDFPKMNFPLKEVLIGVGIVVVVLCATLAIPQVRNLVITKMKEFWDKVKPEFHRLKEDPMAGLWAMLGLLLETAAHGVALVFCVFAVGHSISVAEGIMVYLIGTIIGSAIPVPGGIGSTLAAMVTALHFIGLTTSIATVAVVLFRFATFYLLVPLGGIAFAYMQRKKLL